MTFMPRMSVCKLLPTAVYAICYKLSPSKWWRVCDHTCFCLCEYVCVGVCMCVCVSLHACIMQWWSECVILGCPRSLCVKLSTDQNHRIDTHTQMQTWREIKAPHTCRPALTHRPQMGISPPLTHLPSMFPLSFSLCKYLCSRFISFPPASSLSPSPFLCIFDHFGWKSKSGMSLGLDFISVNDLLSITSQNA